MQWKGFISYHGGAWDYDVQMTTTKEYKKCGQHEKSNKWQKPPWEMQKTKNHETWRKNSVNVDIVI